MTTGAQMLLWSAGALAGIGLSSMFSGLEIGVYTLNRVRLRLRSEAGDRRAEVLADLMRDNRSLLGTLLVGNNIANYLGTSSVAALVALASFSQAQAGVIVPLIIAPILVVFGEIVPKNIFHRYADRYTYYFARPLLWCRRILTATGLLPVVNLLMAMFGRIERRSRRGAVANPLHPRQQLATMISESLHQGALTPYQSTLVERVMNLRNIDLGQAMVPMAKVWAVPEDISREQFVAQARARPFSRLPVFRGKPANVIGTASVIEVTAGPADKPVREFVNPPVNLKTSQSVVHGLFALQSARRAMGIIRDGSGNAVGIVTIKDLVEEIVGELEAW